MKSINGVTTNTIVHIQINTEQPMVLKNILKTLNGLSLT